MAGPAGLAERRVRTRERLRPAGDCGLKEGPGASREHVAALLQSSAVGALQKHLATLPPRKKDAMMALLGITAAQVRRAGGGGGAPPGARLAER